LQKKFSDLSVDIYDKAGNSTTVSCEMRSSLIEMHFIPGVSNDDTILIRTDDKTIVIDGGRWEARDVIVSYLKAVGVKKIDALIGSHAHWNHIQTHAAIIDNFDVENLYYPVDIINCVSLKHCISRDIKYIRDKVLEKNMQPIVLKAKDKLTYLFGRKILAQLN